jgi:hypothetical protein
VAPRASTNHPPHDRKGAWKVTGRLGFIALLLLLACLPARAQTDYSYYGILDLSYGRFEPSGQYREHRINSNSLSASFIGVEVKHGFEGGWTPGITLETFLRFEERTYGRNDDDPFLSRNAFVSLASDYGTMRAGRIQSFLFEQTRRFNAFGNSTGFSPSIRHLFLSGGLDGVQGDFYWDRAISYSTPRFESGVSGNVMYALGRGDNRGDYVGGYVVYSRGVFAVSLGAQRVHINNGIDDETDETSMQLGASYNFGLARTFVQHTRIRDRGLEVRSRSSSAGVSVPIGPGNVLAQIAYTTGRGPAVERKHTTVSLGYVYAYDSLTDIYILASDDRMRNQTRGVSAAVGVRYTF